MGVFFGFDGGRIGRISESGMSSARKTMAIVIFKWQQKLRFSSLMLTSHATQLAGRGNEAKPCKLPQTPRLLGGCGN